MKKVVLLSAFVIISIVSFCQAKKPAAVKPAPADTLALVMPADTLAIVSAVDIVAFSNYLRKSVSYDAYLKLTPDQVIQELYRFAILEWNKKRKK